MNSLIIFADACHEFDFYWYLIHCSFCVLFLEISVPFFYSVRSLSLSLFLYLSLTLSLRITHECVCSVCMNISGAFETRIITSTK